MKNGERLIGMGLAMVDEKIPNPGIVLPQHDELITFLDQQTDFIRRTGGVTPNILTTLTKFDPTYNAALLACTGEDSRGRFFRSKTESRLGELQINPQKPTGVVVSVLDNAGTVIYRDRHLGAAETVRADKDEISQKNILFVSDLTTIRLPEVFNEADAMLASLEYSEGNFFLNLAGLNPAIASRESIMSVLTALRRQPDIVTGNENELTYLTGSEDMQDAIEQVFPNARIMVITLANKGSLIRYENKIVHLPAHAIPDEKVIDETGSGDTYAGIMLGALYTKPYHEWTQEHILQACVAGTLGGALAVQSYNSRLTDQEMAIVRNYYLKNLKT